jgi:hypothetical protein
MTIGTQIPSADDIYAERGQRRLKGELYKARLRLARVAGAWPNPERREPWQERAIAQAAIYAKLVEERARDEGIDPASISTFGAPAPTAGSPADSEEPSAGDPDTGAALDNTAPG